MPDVRLSDELTIHCEVDDFTDPWARSEAVVFLHGLAESGAIWYAWVPHFSRRFRVLRPDFRGFGRSTVPPEPLSFPWGPHVWTDDLVGLLDALEVDAAHVVAVRVGSTVALKLAAEHPDRVRTLSLISGLARGGQLQGLVPDGGGPVIPLADAPTTIAEMGLEPYVKATNRARIGSEASQKLLDWSAKLQYASVPEVVRGVLTAANGVDLFPILPQITAPTLVIAAAESKAQSIEATAEWQSLIPGSELQVMPGDSPHLALLHPDECARRVLEFIDRVS